MNWVEKQELLAPTQYHANAIVLLPDPRMKISAFHCDTEGTLQAVSEAQEQLPALRYISGTHFERGFKLLTCP